jgi:hypothetical protein
VLSNTLAETRAPAGLQGATSGVSGTVSRAPPKHQGGTSARAADDDTVTVTGVPARPAGTGGQQGDAPPPPAQHAAAIVLDPQPGAIPDGTGLVPAQSPDEVAARTAPGGTGPQQAPGSPAAAGSASKQDEDGYPFSWTKEEREAHRAGDLAQLSALQVHAPKLPLSGDLRLLMQTHYTAVLGSVAILLAQLSCFPTCRAEESCDVPVIGLDRTCGVFILCRQSGCRRRWRPSACAAAAGGLSTPQWASSQRRSSSRSGSLPQRAPSWQLLQRQSKHTMRMAPSHLTGW